MSCLVHIQSVRRRGEKSSSLRFASYNTAKLCMEDVWCRERMKVGIFPSMQLHSWNLSWGFFGVPRADERGKPEGQTEQTALFSGGSFYSWGHHLTASDQVCVILLCVGGLFTFHWFLTGIPLLLSLSLVPLLECPGRRLGKTFGRWSLIVTQLHTSRQTL